MSSAAKSALTALAEFAETTSIGGIGYIYQSKATLLRVFWTSVVIVAFYLTVNDLTNTIRQYLHEETITRVSEEQIPTMHLPHLAICMRQMSESGVSDQLNDWLPTKSVRNTLRFFDTLNVTVTEWMASQARNKQTTGNHQVALFFITAMFNSISSVEYQFLNFVVRKKVLLFINFDWGFPLCSVDVNAMQLDCTAIGQPIVQMRNYLVKKNVDFLQLRNIIAVTWTSLWDLRLNWPTSSEINSTWSMLHDNNPIVTWFGAVPYMQYESYGLCYRLPNVESSLTFNEIFAPSWLKIKVQNMTNFYISMDVLFSTGKTITDGEGTRNLVKWVFVDPHPFTFDSAEQSFYRDVEVTYLKHHTMANLRRQPCLTSLAFTHVDCRLQCQADFFESMCGCRPMFLVQQHLKSSTHYCALKSGTNETSNTISDLSACSGKLLTWNDTQLNACYDECPPDCSTSTFSFQTSGLKAEKNVFAFTMASYGYQKVVEDLVMSPNEFTASLGGLIGLWTGASAIAYIHVVVSILTWLGAKVTALMPSKLWKTQVAGEM